MLAGWTDEELASAVESYLEMLALEQAGRRYSKAEFRRRLTHSSLRERSASSFEFRMRNISAVLEDRGEVTIRGYAPATQVGRGVRRRIGRIIDQLRADRPTAAARIIYINIGWMERYQGQVGEVGTLGSHAYLKAHRFGAETFNFQAAEGRVQGYRPGHTSTIRLERLGAPASADEISGVLVIWMAREPLSNRMLVVGWYRDATVFRQGRTTSRPRRTMNGEAILYSATTTAANAKLLPVPARQFEVPSSKQLSGGFGQSPIWYGVPAVNERVVRFIEQIEHRVGAAPKKRPKPGSRNLDPELRRRVEKAAVDHAIAFYKSAEGGSCEVTSVEADARGWDLEAERPDGVRHLIEVKGLQGSQLRCEVTPNEYEKMCDRQYQADYVVYVVSNALTQPIASVFRHDGEDGWVSIDGRRLQVQERVAAVLSCN